VSPIYVVVTNPLSRLEVLMHTPPLPLPLPITLPFTLILTLDPDQVIMQTSSMQQRSITTTEVPPPRALAPRTRLPRHDFQHPSQPSHPPSAHPHSLRLRHRHTLSLALTRTLMIPSLT